MSLLLELKRLSLFGEIITQFHMVTGGYIKIDRLHSFTEGPYKGKRLHKEIFLTSEEFEQLKSLEIDE